MNVLPINLNVAMVIVSPLTRDVINSLDFTDEYVYNYVRKLHVNISETFYLQLFLLFIRTLI